uniref:uncharacterized protein LOC120825070 isoform X3 n=2 Tax=Gasterosteus aculeatus aculeatus TaxID=481459 RepID=UPI001A98462B|nr:uncharacterized protein LOC120825070 isoform X3 [Gasterosteus aculeatus aculeatus]
MTVEAGPPSGDRQRARGTTSKMDVEEPHLDFEGAEGLLSHRDMNTSGQWEERRGDEDIQDKLLLSCCTAELHIERVSLRPITEYWVYSDDQHDLADCAGGETFITPPSTPVPRRPCPFIPVPGSLTADACAASSGGTSADTCAPISSLCRATCSDRDALSPGCCDGDPVCAAAHLHLLGESLSLIGHHLQETNKAVSASSSASLLLDSLLCAVAPLIGLTEQVPELRSCTRHTLRSTMENISYLMPGL